VISRLHLLVLGKQLEQGSCCSIVDCDIPGNGLEVNIDQMKTCTVDGGLELACGKIRGLRTVNDGLLARREIGWSLHACC